MNFETLRFYDKWLKLGLTETELKTIKEGRYPKDKFGNNFTHGYVILAIKKKAVIGFSLNDYTYFIKERKELRVAKDVDMKIGDLILFNNLIRMDTVPEQLFTLGVLLRSYQVDLKIDGVITSEDHLRKLLLRKLSEKRQIFYYSVNLKKFDKADKEQEKILGMLASVYWLFKADDVDIVKKDVELRANVPRIIKVLEHNNYRCAIVKESANKTYNNGMCHVHVHSRDYSGIIYKHTDKEYDYIDEGRECIKTMLVSDELNETLTYIELEELYDIFPDHTLLTAQLYNGAAERLNINVLNKEKQQLIETAREKISSKHQKAFNVGKFITISGIKIRKGEIRYRGKSIKSDLITQYVSGAKVLFSNELNFEPFIRNFLFNVLQYDTNYIPYVVRFKDKKEFQINNIKIVAERRDTGRYFLNGVNIRRTEYSDVIIAALGMKSQEEFDAFVKKAGKIPLETQKVLSTGLDIKLGIDKLEGYSGNFEGTYVTHMAFREDKDNKMYVKIGSKEYHISALRRFLDVQNQGRGYYSSDRCVSVVHFCTVLKDSLKGFDYDDFIKHLKGYRKRQEDNVKRAEEFIKHAVKITNTETIKDGYVVTSVSKVRYFIDKAAKVYRLERDQDNKIVKNYRCIVDLNVGLDQEFEIKDSIAKRILAVHKDAMLTGEIHTLKLDSNPTRYQNTNNDEEDEEEFVNDVAVDEQDEDGDVEEIDNGRCCCLG
jgi:hypothetical protein